MTHLKENIMNLPFFAKLFMPLERVPGKLFTTKLALRWQLGDRILDRQVPGGGTLAYFNATVGASRGLVPQSSISQEMSKTSGAHQVAIDTL